MSRRPLVRLALLGAALLLTGAHVGDGSAAPLPSRSAPLRPDVVIVTVDTLRADRVGAYGYARNTTPNVDRFFEHAVRFSRARVVEPLTNPSLCSMMTSMYPQDHGASRNGLRMRPGLASLPKVLADYGYTSAAFVGNWTLRNKLSGMGEHFDEYEEVLNRKRWLGFLRSEATAEDLSGAAIDWVDDHLDVTGRGPFLLWVHYVEPHAPYRFHDQFAESLGIPTTGGKVAPSDRYDTEVAFVDAQIGRLLGEIESRLASPPLVIFAGDHGESLGEHGYWGHGRNLYEPGLRVPMGLSWKGQLRPAVVEGPAVNLDLAPTVLGLLDLPMPASFRGYDWTAVLRGGPGPASRVTYYQAHKGAVISKHESDLARRRGLLAVGLIDGDLKEVWTLDDGRYELLNLADDPGEHHDLSSETDGYGAALRNWEAVVSAGLSSLDDVPPEPLDDASARHLRDLGYVD